MKVGVVGLGYVGLPLAVAFAEAGVGVVGVDVCAERVRAVQAGRSPVEDVSSARLGAVAGTLSATADHALLADVDATIICVPTPLSVNREPDLGPLLSAGRAVAAALRPGQLVVLESTTFPGTTREYLVPLLEEGSGLVAGRDFHVAFSPERLDPGREDHDLRSTPKVVAGYTDACRERACAVYETVCDTLVQVSTLEAAELSKLLENIFRSVNIALVNEMAMLTDRMGIDIWEVIDAAATKPYGFMRFDPGPGMGGHCLPVDPFYLSWRAREFDFQTEFIELAGKVNQQMPYHCFERAARVLNQAGKAVNGSRIGVVGVSYKAGIGDVRESPALKIIDVLRQHGGQVRYHDPHVPELRGMNLRSEPLAELLDSVDLAVIVTAHPSVDHREVAARAPLLLDLRGVTRARPRIGRGRRDVGAARV